MPAFPVITVNEFGSISSDTFFKVGSFLNPYKISLNIILPSVIYSQVFLISFLGELYSTRWLNLSSDTFKFVYSTLIVSMVEKLSIIFW